jgi:hypothetical protein
VKAILCRGLCVAGVLVTGRALGEPPVAPARSEAPGRSGDASVSLGVVREQSDVHSELAGFVRVELPLERFVAPRRVLVASADEASFVADDDGLGPDARQVDGVEPDGAVRPALDAALLGGLARETLGAALAAHGVGAFERELDGAASRARTSAVLPEVRLRAARTRDAALRLAPTTEDPYHSTLADGDGMFLEAQATFRLNRLVFADEEVPLERLRIERERLNERLELRVLGRVVAWHRALSRERSATEPEARGRAALERIDAEVELDALTGGFFGARVRSLRLSSAKASAPRSTKDGAGAPSDNVTAERRGPPPQKPAGTEPASKSKSVAAGPAEGGIARADLDGCRGSATSRAPCLPRLATESRTFSGALMR